VWEQYNLAKMLANGEGGTKDAVTARRLYRKAARKGHADSKFNLALMYWKGLGGNTNHTDARRLFSELADLGDADACFRYEAHASRLVARLAD
jgi:TPR repeat protein